LLTENFAVTVYHCLAANILEMNDTGLNLQNTSLQNTNPRRILHSWKEISSYLGRGVRTIQRYEVDLAFPIHRLSGSRRSAVLAFSDEIDQWLASSPTRQNRKAVAAPLEHCRAVHEKAKLSIDQAVSLRSRIETTRMLIEKLTAAMARNQTRRDRTRLQA
jgi:predicted DNA-binding transcriptional regulator AlpA